jgi:hypothetical protein
MTFFTSSSAVVMMIFTSVSGYYAAGFFESADLFDGCSSIAHSPVKWLALQLLLLALAIVATFSRRSGQICKPVADIRLSPVEFVHTLGGLYERAGSASVAVDICYQRFRYWLTRRLGAASNTPAEDLQSAVRDRWGLTDDHFVAIMRRCESARSDPYLHAPEALYLVQELDDYASRLNIE